MITKSYHIEYISYFIFIYKDHKIFVLMKKFLVMMVMCIALVGIASATITLTNKNGDTISYGSEYNSSSKIVRISSFSTSNLGFVVFGASNEKEVELKKTKKLCGPCKAGKTYNATISLKEGKNYLVINENGENKSYTINVDSRDPKIKVIPSKTKYSDGKFEVIVSGEKNMPSVKIFYRNQEDSDYKSESLSCSEYTKTEKEDDWNCSTDLSSSLSGDIIFNFSASDGVNTVKSNKLRANVDKTKPVIQAVFIKVLPPINRNTSSIPTPTLSSLENLMGGVTFAIGSNELVKMKYEIDSDGKLKTLCNSCSYIQKTLKLNPGMHSLNITAEDKAGNKADNLFLKIDVSAY